MNESAIDTLTIAHRLQDAGFDDKQAEAVTFAIRDGITGVLASKEDITNLRGEMKEDIANLRGEMKEDITNLRGEMKEDTANLRGEIIALDGKMETQGRMLEGKINLIYWMLSVLVAGVASLVIKAFFS